MPNYIRTNDGGLTANLPLGVHRVGNKFVATIGHDRRKHHLGTFDTAEAASEEYVNAKRRLHAGCTI